MNSLRKLFLRLRHDLVAAAAGSYRRLLRRTTFIAVTGTAGKTTTKELIHAILSRTFRGTRTIGTYSTFGPLTRTVLKTMPWHRFCVLETSTWYKGTIRECMRIYPPDIAVVTTVGLEHFSVFRNVEAVAEEKTDIVRALGPDGVAVLNLDDPLVAPMREHSRGIVLGYGYHEQADVRALKAESVWPERLSLELDIRGNRYRVQTRLCGTQWVTCLLAAITVAWHMGVPMNDIAQALLSYEPFPGRMSPVEFSDGVTFIRDDWKSPYWSIGLPLEFMRQARAARKIIVIGTISDYPGSASGKYRLVASHALECADLVVFYGPNSYMVKKLQREVTPDRLKIMPEFNELDAYLSTILQAGDLVLLKASGKANNLDQIIENRKKTVQIIKG